MENTVDLYANGKLLITGEYLVLKGARALAWPVKLGQSLSASPLKRPVIEWNSRDTGGTWLSAEISLPDLRILSEEKGNIGTGLQLLRAVKELKPDFFSADKGLGLDFSLNYPREWGLGSSSTLIWLISRLAAIDAYELLYKISQGSGYDIACASRKEAFFYTKNNTLPFIEKAVIGRGIREHGVFAWLGNKQDTQPEVRNFIENSFSSEAYLPLINKLGEAISREEDEIDLCRLVKEHEKILSEILHKDPVATLFPDFPGAVKSLGAWGGDFAMFVSSYDTARIKNILNDYGLQTMFTFDELSIF